MYTRPETVTVPAANTVRLTVGEGGPAAGGWVVGTPLVAVGVVPGVELVTSKMTVQLPAVGMVMPVKLSAVAPAARVVGVVPTHVPVTFPATAAILTSVSVKLAPVKALAFVFVNVKVIVEVPPDGIEVGLKDFAIVGGANTVKLTLGEGGPATGVWVVVTPLVAFGFVPGVELVTSKMTERHQRCDHHPNTRR